jgi:formiminotetrahydrofolate cyclodeaminase
VTPMPRLGEHPWLGAYAAPTVTPGGGSASAVAAALGCALLAMAAQIGGRKAQQQRERLQWLADEAERLRGALVEQERADAGVYERMVATVRAARATAGDPGAERAAESARADATDVPLVTAELAAEGLALAEELASMGLARTVSDQLVAAHLLRAGLEGGIATVSYNLGRLAEGAVRDQLTQRLRRLEAARRTAAQLIDRLTGLVG